MWPFRSKPAQELLDAFTRAGTIRVEDSFPAHRAILDAEPALQAQIIAHLGRAIEKAEYPARYGFLNLLERLLRKPPELDATQLADMLGAPMAELPLAGTVGVIEQHVAKHGLGEPLRRSVVKYRNSLREHAGAADARKFGARLDAVLFPKADGPAAHVDGDTWGGGVASAVEASGARAAWVELLRHANEAVGKSKPTQKWSKRAAELLAPIGASAFARQLEAWMEVAKLGHTHQPQWGDKVELGMSDRNQDVLKGLVWTAASVNDPALAHSIAKFGERCFKKIPNFGASSTRLGNACIHTLSAMPDGIGVAHLSRLTEKVRYASGKRTLDKALDNAAERAGQSREDIEELAVPDVGLDASGKRRIAIGDHHAELAIIDGLRVELEWLRPNGKSQASVPKPLKDAHPDEVKAITKERKQLEDLLAGQTARLQRLWMNDRRLPLGELRRRYLEHPVVGQIARQLVWLAEGVQLMWDRGKLARIDGDPVTLPDDAEARLWHTIDCDDVDELAVLRDLIETRDITQPFKQVWREVYKPRDGKATSDARFAGHIIRQHPFRNLAQQRGWQYDVQGYWDSANTPQLTLPRWDLTVQLEVTPVEHGADDHIFNYLVVGELTFRHLQRAAELRMDAVPPIVFSEIMRDVDMFVGVATVANDPAFDPKGFSDTIGRYWRDAIFGDLAPQAETRREVLARVLPRTILRDRARLEGRWLVIDSAGGSSRIHLGTANVQTQDASLPHVLEIDRDARTRAASVFLPFEGDSILADILAKALVLAGV